MFVSLEGPEGAGKSTLAGDLAARLRRAGHEVVVTFEPGGTDLGRQVREIVRHGVAKAEGTVPAASATLDRAISPRAETLLFCAARAQLVDEVIVPCLRRGGVVICDRYADSTLAYQCYGRGLSREPVRAILDFATAGVWPDLTVLLDLDVREGLGRKRRSGEAGAVDRFESEAVEFHERVRRGYLELAAEEPNRWLVVSAVRPPEQVAAEVWEQISRRLEERARGVRR